MQARMKVVGEGCYYHLFNRISGCRGEHPFTDIDKEYGFRLLRNLCDYFLIEVISAAWMGNHFHLVVYAPAPDELPSLEIIAKRHNDYYKSMRKSFKYGPSLPIIKPKNEKMSQQAGLRMIDISRFMAAYQQRFTNVYNETRERHGQLWSGRFKSVILDKGNSLEACVLYVELNPVRAGLTDSPADYRFTTWGRFCGSGKHMFHDNFIKHMKLNNQDTDLFTYFRGEMTRIVVSETGASSEEIYDAKQTALRKESMQIRYLRRTRHFRDGAILGSKLFIRQMGSKFTDPARAHKKQLSRGTSPTGNPIYLFPQTEKLKNRKKKLTYQTINRSNDFILQKKYKCKVNGVAYLLFQNYIGITSR